jgi:long-subunit fatty acid transport protein
MFKKTLLLSLAASSLLATNGVNMIGTSTVSRSMGGTGVAYYTHATEALHKNVSLMGDIGEKSEFQLDVTYFSASVNSTVYDKMPLANNVDPLPNVPSYDAPYTASSQNMLDTNFIPSISYVTRINDQVVVGFAMIGAAGMATQYEGDYPQHQMNTSMMLMKLIPAISYRQGNTTFGFAPVLGLGSMSLNYDEAYMTGSGNNYYSSTNYPFGTKPQSQRSGLFGTNIGGDELIPAFGFTAGMDVKVTDKFRVGMSYNSALKYTFNDVANFSQFGPNGMVYMTDEWMRNNTGVGLSTSSGENVGEQLTNALISGGMNSTTAGLIGSTINALSGTDTIKSALDATNPANLDDLTLEQPWEIAIGISYAVTKKTTMTFDYRYVAWGLAEGYKDFGWENQQVFAIGMEYKGNGFSLRGGYNYAASPISNATNESGALLSDVQGHLVFDQALSMLNLVGFPAISTTHFTAGFGYAFSEDVDFDFTGTYSPEATTTRAGALSPFQTGLDAVDMNYEYSTSMEQLTLSFGVNYRF